MPFRQMSDARPRTKTSRPAAKHLGRFSTVNAKFVMAVTGLGLLAFVTIHMLGNLQIYLGQDALNAYAKKLKGMPALLWAARLGLLATFVGHVTVAIWLKRRNRAARSTSYVVRDSFDTTLASRTMLTSGLVVLAFTLFHLAHFTLGYIQGDAHHLTDSQGRHDVYSMVVLGFQNRLISALYLVAMIVLWFHLKHAIVSVAQTLGISTAKNRRLIAAVGLALSTIIVLGNISIPVSVMTGLVQLPTSGVTP